MCGIFGLVETPWRASAKDALRALGTRGPDEQAVADLGAGVFGHTRLAVIDPAGGRQPMHSPDGRYTIVFNGEIYNFNVLRAELAARGYAFLTRSDTEVLLHGFREWGEAVIPRLDGMFAFAIWDRRERRIIAARDRMGVKPFFYSTLAGFAFASTLAPFMRLEGFPRRLDYAALRDYLAFQTPLAPHTMLADVRQLPPASVVTWDAAENRVRTRLYWDIPRARTTAPPQAELVERVDAALAASVQRQLVADVPLGAFLSGGIDSSLLVHYMTQAGGRPLKTFSMRFADPEFDESAHARAVAEAFGSEHHVLDAPDIDGEYFAAAIGDLDQPLADPAYVMMHALARLTRAHVTVALSGDGGDEVFGGYARFLDDESRYPRRAGQAFFRRQVEAGRMPAALLRRTLYGRERVFYRHVELGPWPVSRKSLRRYLAPEALARSAPAETLGLWHALVAAHGGKMDTATLMRADLWTYLSENCLVKTDRASMAHGLEVRVPMLGNQVLDAVLALPAGAHFDPKPKALLRALAARHLPRAVWDRPKHGFSVPLQKLFNGTWRATCERAIAQSQRLAPFLQRDAVLALWRDVKRGRASRRLAYTLIVLLLWLDKNRVQA